MERPIIKDKAVSAYVDYLEHKLSGFERSPYLNSYLALKKMLDKGNEQLISLASVEIDFEGDAFKGASKFMSLQRDYSDQMDYFRSKMTATEREAVDTSNLGIAEKLALNSKK